MTTVILAEKPKQAMAYAEAFKHSVRKNGYYEVSDNIFSGKTLITYAIGHLIELAPPAYYDDKWKDWKVESLPIFPRNYEFLVSKDMKDQYEIVSSLLKEAQTIIIATDCDREGENIAWSIINKANAYSENKTFKRLWINSLEVDAIREGFKNLKPAKEYHPYYIEAQTRQISDWLVGMNATMLYTLNMKKKGVEGTFSVGRVQTPSLYLIYSRQLQIENFKKEKYYEIEGVVQSEKDEFKAHLSPSERFRNLIGLNGYLQNKKASLGRQEGTITVIEKEDKTTSSPKLFSLSGLQSKINSLYGATAIQTLSAVQKLYEAKLLSYPRTDTEVITTNEFAYLKSNISQYQAFLNSDAPIINSEARSKYVNNKKVQEHYAIIPTKKAATKEQFEKLDPLQQKVYMLVMKTTVAMFLDDYHYQETIVESKVSDLVLKSTGRTPLKQGWKVLFSTDGSTTEESEEIVQKLPQLKVGDKVNVVLNSVEKETKPPKAYTEGTLLTAMKNVNKDIDDQESKDILKEVEGIGTEATRASIIEALKKRKYIVLEKNKLVVTEQGKLLCNAVQSQKLLTSAEMTAKWESKLKEIGQNKADQQSFINRIKKFIVHLIEHVPSDIEKLDFQAYEVEKKKEFEKSIVGKCPQCGKEVVSKISFYGCSNYPECKFSIPNNFRKKKLTKNNIKLLLEGNETIVSSIKSKDKKPYSAVIKLGNNGMIEFVSFHSVNKK